MTMTWKQLDARLSRWLFKSFTAPLDLIASRVRRRYWLEGDIFTFKRPFCRPVSLRIDEFDEIGVETTDHGPFVEDVFWILKRGDVRLRIGGPHPLFKTLMDRFGSLEGFDWRPFAEAQSCTDNRYFLCWRNHPQIQRKSMRKKVSAKFKVLFVAGFGPIVQDIPKSHKFYVDTLGLSFQKEGDYLHTAELDGVEHFALWPLSQAAQSCFGSESWPPDVPVPQAWLEFDVDDIEQASTELKKKGYTLLTKARKEPWGQIVTRLLSPEGLLVAVTVTPAMREE